MVSDELAAALWSRVNGQLADIVIDGDPHGYNLHGIPSLMQGTWKPMGLNNVRVCQLSIPLA